MTPRQASTAALAARIHYYASAREWDVTIYDLAELCDCTATRAMNICRVRGWLPRLRGTIMEHSHGRLQRAAYATGFYDDDLEALARHA